MIGYRLMLALMAAGLAISQPAAAEPSPDARALHQKALEKGEEIKRLWSPGNVSLYWPKEDGPVWFTTAVSTKAAEIQQVDPATGAITPAIDVGKFAAAMTAKGLGQPGQAQDTPLEHVVPEAAGFRFRVGNKWWRCSLPGYQIEASEPARQIVELSPPGRPRRPGESGQSIQLVFDNKAKEEISLFYLDGRKKPTSYGKIGPGKTHDQQTFTDHRWQVRGPGGKIWGELTAAEGDGYVTITGPVEDDSTESRNPRISPDGRWRVSVRDHNVALQQLPDGAEKPLTTDGLASNHFEESTVLWSPDSRHFAIRRLAPAPDRKITLVESSPKDQVQPKTKTIHYTKPGDAIETHAWRIFEAETGAARPPDDTLCPTPWRLSEEAWSPDGKEFTYLYNQRGHQVLRLVGLDVATGKARTLIEETSKTFIDYSRKTWMHRLPESREILWASERTGWNHLYLVDAITGKIQNPITSGNWNVKEVVDVDAKNRCLLLKVLGVYPDQDPYHEHWMTIGFDGKNPIHLTDADGTHDVRFSPDKRWLLATWSRVDHPPVSELRDARDGRKIATLLRSDDAPLRQAGWSRPERFVAPGRDAITSIHGIIIKPTGFDPAKNYPVVENIYAGPHDAFVRKEFKAWDHLHEMAECGFIVVKIDGMGTNWRGKAFHDVAWKNLKDAGFPDRIPWIKAAASTRPWMDLQRVGIFGGSAGGQNALSALLHHGDFYKVAVADCGCHDNRMDKIWWNEAWMGWPVDESYANNSNVTHAAKLQGKLLLVVGELDENVDPASTMQVVNALQKADKDFDLIVMTGVGHGAAESPYGKRRRTGFLIEHLLR